MKMVSYEAFACCCEAGDVVLRESYKPNTHGKLYYACPLSKPREDDFRCDFLWKEKRLCLLVSSPETSTTTSYSPGPSTPLSYSLGPSTPSSYSLGPSRNADLFGKMATTCTHGFLHLVVASILKNESNYKKEPHFTKPESSFAFGSYDKNEDEQNDCNDGVDENTQPIYHKWKKFMSFKPDIPETPSYKSKPMISKHYNKETGVEVGNIFYNKEAIDLAIRLKALDDGYHVLKRKLLVTMLAETYHAIVQDWYFKCREVAANMRYDITNWVADKVHKRKLKSTAWIVHGVNQYQYQVSDGRYNCEVNFLTGSCECRKWKLSGIPCGHVIAVTSFMGLTDYVQSVADWFKKTNIKALTRNQFILLEICKNGNS
ncbi:transposase, MuDR, MULE transposase domain protein [Tanacetum coccineum]